MLVKGSLRSQKIIISYQESLPLLVLGEALFEILIQCSALVESLVQSVCLHALHHPHLHGSTLVVVLGIRDGTRHVREDVAKERLGRHLKADKDELICSR